MQTVRVDTVRRLERAAESTAQLMLEAGKRAADIVGRFRKEHPFLHDKRTVIICGRGNNGGDGLVVARFLVEKHQFEHVEVISLLTRDELRADCFFHGAKLPRDVVFRKVNTPEEVDLKDCLIVEALIGSGVMGVLKSPFPEWIDAINLSGSAVIALDIPCGVDGDSGRAAKAVRADLTVTFGLPKVGLFLDDGAKNCSRVEYVPIGLDLTKLLVGESDFECFTSVDARRMLARLPSDAYKNTRGQIAILAGSPKYPNAPVLNADGALALGSGVVALALRVRPYASLAPQLIARKVADYGVAFDGPQRLELEELVLKSQVILCGSGWGEGSALKKVLTWVISQPCRLVLDADALNLLAQNPDMCNLGDSAVITPHAGEAKRLCRALKIKETLPPNKMAGALSKSLNAIVVLKGAQSWIADPRGRLMVVASGTPALAKAGSGDVLAGVIAGALGQYSDMFEATAFGVYVHGMAAGYSGQRAFRIDDLGRKIGEYLSEISPLA